jgi:hypothetical protein
MISVNIPTSSTNKIGPTIVSRPVSGTSINQLKLITGNSNRYFIFYLLTTFFIVFVKMDYKKIN